MQKRNDHCKGWRIKECVTKEGRQEDIYYSWYSIPKWSFCPLPLTLLPCVLYVNHFSPKDLGRLECYGVSPGDYFQKFQRIVVPLSSVWNSLKLLFDPFILKMMAIWSIGTLGSIYPTTKSIIPEDLNLNQNSCQKVKSHILSFIFITSALLVEITFLEMCKALLLLHRRKWWIIVHELLLYYIPWFRAPVQNMQI